MLKKFIYYHWQIVFFIIIIIPMNALSSQNFALSKRKTEVSLVSLGMVTWIGSELFKEKIGPDSCRWCDGNSNKDSLNVIDRNVRDTMKWNDTRTAHIISNYSGFVLVPVLSLTGELLAIHDNDSNQITEDFFVIAETMIIAANINQIAKFSFARQRPYSHYKNQAGFVDSNMSVDDNLSFYSGHTSFAFSLAVSAGTLSELRNYKYSWMVWTGGLASAAFTGYMRIAADKHYFSDVVVGAVVGSAFGFAIPYFIHDFIHDLKNVKDDNPQVIMNVSQKNPLVAFQWIW